MRRMRSWDETLSPKVLRARRCQPAAGGCAPARPPDPDSAFPLVGPSIVQRAAMRCCVRRERALRAPWPAAGAVAQSGATSGRSQGGAHARPQHGAHFGIAPCAAGAARRAAAEARRLAAHAMRVGSRARRPWEFFSPRRSSCSSRARSGCSVSVPERDRRGHGGRGRSSAGLERRSCRCHSRARRSRLCGLSRRCCSVRGLLYATPISLCG